MKPKKPKKATRELVGWIIGNEQGRYLHQWQVVDGQSLMLDWIERPEFAFFFATKQIAIEMFNKIDQGDCALSKVYFDYEINKPVLVPEQ